jgi:triphosphoribosyl-dephospho-CoA synthetase
MAMARVQYQEKTAEFASIDRRFDATELAIRKMAEGHTQLYRRVDELSAKALKDELSAIVKDLQNLRQQTQALQ